MLFKMKTVIVCYVPTHWITFTNLEVHQLCQLSETDTNGQAPLAKDSHLASTLLVVEVSQYPHSWRCSECGWQEISLDSRRGPKQFNILLNRYAKGACMLFIQREAGTDDDDDRAFTMSPSEKSGRISERS